MGYRPVADVASAVVVAASVDLGLALALWPWVAITGVAHWVGEDEVGHVGRGWSGLKVVVWFG